MPTLGKPKLLWFLPAKSNATNLQKLITNPQDEKKKTLSQIKNEAWNAKMYIYIYIYTYVDPKTYVYIYIYTKTNKNCTYLEVDVKTLLIRTFWNSLAFLRHCYIHTHIDHQLDPDPNPSGMIRPGTKKTYGKFVWDSLKKLNLDPT